MEGARRMRPPIALLVIACTVAPCQAQNFPSTLTSTSNAVVCKDPEGLAEGIQAHEKKDQRALRKAGCRLLRAGMQVGVQYAQRVGRESYHLIRISWRRGPSLWGYSYDFK
jgi:hypothetical protein